VSAQTPARQRAQRLVDEMTALAQEVADLEAECARLGAEAEGLRRQLAEAQDRDGVPVLAYDEEG